MSQDFEYYFICDCCGAEDPVAEIYIDGACPRNGQPGAKGGIGVYWGPDDPRNVSEPLRGQPQTNNRPEIQAAVRAIRDAKKDGFLYIFLYTDSRFLIDSKTRYMDYWLAHDWTRPNGAPVVNKLDFQKLNKVERGTHVEYLYVEAHSGDPGNDAADALARAGVRKHRY